MSKSPGRELDAEVAEKVMGMVWCKCSKWHGAWETYTVGDEYCKCDECGDSVPYPMKYSTDISAAWEVVEKLRKDGIMILLQSDDDGYTVANNYDGVILQGWEEAKKNFDVCWWSSNTAPHVICLAALKAVGYEEKKQN